MTASPLWEYEDARGVTYRGHVESIHDFGGTDVRHGMRALDDTFSMLSGSRLKAARVLYGEPHEH